jgi:3-deoxy-manno-octulosonate cytidylyltransferase (CMP-KDO synthetase)
MDQKVGTYKVCCIIPSRINSSRFPGKPLVKLNGRELILRVCDIASQCKLIDKIIVATEDEIISNLVTINGYDAAITSKQITCTHRVSDVAKQLNYDYFINIQGDEPCLNSLIIDRMINFSIQNDHNVVQATYPISQEDLEDEDCVKAVVNNGKIIYLTRNPEIITQNLTGIAGVYVYKKSSIVNFTSYDLTLVEAWEGLDTLGFIGKDDVIPYEFPSRTFAIDRPSDVKVVEKYLP